MFIKYLNKLKRLLNNLYSIPFSNRKYQIKKGYKHRSSVEHFDDTQTNDEWQKEVYEYAHNQFILKNYKSILDIGCGSGFKLLKHFSAYNTIGVEIKPTIDFLKKKFPFRSWKLLNEVYGNSFDMVIIADVIEHVENPDLFIKEIFENINFKSIIISTPDRNLLHSKFHFGPPTNPCHFREWNFKEFSKFINKYIQIEDHIISNKYQGTQLVFGQKK
jgi:cyclopropane fatty-acyl-phospholipid synthase-like methyltransferase